MILILGGTSDTHKVVKTIDKEYIISVATDYGYVTFSKLYRDRVVKIRFDKDSLKKFIVKHNITKIIDTTHPYAKTITTIAKSVSKSLNITYIDKKRSIMNRKDVNYEKAVFFDNTKDVIDFLKTNCSRILFSIGSKNIELFKEFKDIGYFRVLPFEESIKKCRNIGIDYNRIIAVQGPFSVNFNKTIIEEFCIDCIVTKNSGQSGGLIEKIEACQEKDIYIIILDT